MAEFVKREIMSAFVIYHLVIGLPFLVRNLKSRLGNQDKPKR